MDKETLSNYGWVVCVILVLAIMISLATPFGSVIRDRVAGTVENFKSNSEEVLDNVGGATSFDDLGGGGAGGGEPAHACVDSNTDYHCDECEAVIPHACQVESHEFFEGNTYVDVCRLCGAHECTNFDEDYYVNDRGFDTLCDICGAYKEHDHYVGWDLNCDTCGEIMEHDCEDDGSGYCWLCGCHVCYDNDSDSYCDDCLEPLN